MKYIQGDARNQPTLLPAVLDDYISENNPSRVIDAFVDSLDLLELDFDKSTVSKTGRPPYSPYDLLKLFIYGYFNKVRSSRKLETETHRNVEVMWLLNNLKPDHKTISRFRKNNLATIKKVFDSFVKLCIKMNLYNRQLISIDGSCFAAVNSKERNFTKIKLQDRIARINAHITEYLTELEVTNTTDKGKLHGLTTKCKDILETDELTSLADKGYISATDIANCISDGITANVSMDVDSLGFCIETDEVCPKPTSHTNGRIVYLNNHNICVCPMGEILYPGNYHKAIQKVRFYNRKACAKCTKKCTTAKFACGEFSIKKSEYSKEYNDKNLRLKQIHYIPDKELLKQRKSLSEHPFGIVKRCLGADYLLLKRFTGATAEIALAYLAFNMKRAINILGFEGIMTAIQA